MISNKRMALSCSKILLHLHYYIDELKSHEKVCKSKDSCGIVMPSEKDKVLEFDQ